MSRLFSGRSGKESLKVEQTGPKRVIDFSDADNKKQIKYFIKGQYFTLSIPESYIFLRTIESVMAKEEEMVALFTDFNKYNVNWSFGPIQTKIESVCEG